MKSVAIRPKPPGSGNRRALRPAAKRVGQKRIYHCGVCLAGFPRHLATKRHEEQCAARLRRLFICCHCLTLYGDEARLERHPAAQARRRPVPVPAVRQALQIGHLPVPPCGQLARRAVALLLRHVRRQLQRREDLQRDAGAAGARRRGAPPALPGVHGQRNRQPGRRNRGPGDAGGESRGPAAQRRLGRRPHLRLAHGPGQGVVHCGRDQAERLCVPLLRQRVFGQLGPGAAPGAGSREESAGLLLLRQEPWQPGCPAVPPATCPRAVARPCVRRLPGGLRHRRSPEEAREQPAPGPSAACVSHLRQGLRPALPSHPAHGHGSRPRARQVRLPALPVALLPGHRSRAARQREASVEGLRRQSFDRTLKTIVN
ncbi:hypothetical protein M5D96_012663 [Drosophila gunungcola]|uniref:Uncharacterized protein n=1 Tax=Drosophila gunungcola TaxID=103775 RepID=A0A9Q0BKC4_9MUSC|nr:hypothetical protein M5D96_012663 [Drosophila gunungcola]